MYSYEHISGSNSKYENIISSIEDLKDELNIQDSDLDSLMLDDIADQVIIEGNQLAKKEVTYFLLKDVTIRGEKFRDFIQTKNEEFSGRILREEVKKQKFVPTPEAILFLHRIITSGELPEKECGHFREESVHIRYTSYLPPMPEDVPKLMEELTEEYQKPLRSLETRFERICEWKRNFERIHPFIDGNGRVGRLVMNLLFLQNGYGYLHIPAEERDLYFSAIESNTLHEFFAPRMLRTMEIIQGMQRERNR